MDECAGARRVSGLVTALEISPPSKSRRRVQRLEIKSRRGEISRKYGIIYYYYYGTSVTRAPLYVLYTVRDIFQHKPRGRMKQTSACHVQGCYKLRTIIYCCTLDGAIDQRVSLSEGKIGGFKGDFVHQQ